jgi:hypothetical protein
MVSYSPLDDGKLLKLKTSEESVLIELAFLPSEGNEHRSPDDPGKTEYSREKKKGEAQNGKDVMKGLGLRNQNINGYRARDHQCHVERITDIGRSEIKARFYGVALTALRAFIQDGADLTGPIAVRMHKEFPFLARRTFLSGDGT